MASKNEIKTNVYNAMVAAGWQVSTNPALMKVHEHNNILIDELYDGVNWKEKVVSRWDPTTSLPASPQLFDRYIATATANGWTNKNMYQWSGLAWGETVYDSGMIVFVIAENNFYGSFSDTWLPLIDTGVAPHDNHGSILRIGNFHRFRETDQGELWLEKTFDGGITWPKRLVRWF